MARLKVHRSLFYEEGLSSLVKAFLQKMSSAFCATAGLFRATHVLVSDLGTVVTNAGAGGNADSNMKARKLHRSGDEAGN